MPRRGLRTLSSVWNGFVAQLNFFRIHVLFFTLAPLVCACIFYAANGQNKVEFIDCLFLCYSAMTSTGLATINISTATGFQQALLVLQMIMGGLVTVSWFMVFIRRRFFLQKFEHIVTLSRTRSMNTTLDRSSTLRFPSIFSRRATTVQPSDPPAEGKRRGPLSLNMIRRTTSQPQRVDPSGKVVHTSEVDKDPAAATKALESVGNGGSLDNGISVTPNNYTTGVSFEEPAPQSPSPAADPIPRGSLHAENRFPRTTTMPRSTTIEIREPNLDRSGQRIGLRRQDSIRNEPRGRRGSISSGRTAETARRIRNRERGFGGWSSPNEMIVHLIRKVFPNFHRHMTRTLSIALAESLPTSMQAAPYLSFSAVVGRNSKFHGLSSEQLEELGGVEFRALTMLLWLVGAYFILLHLIVWAFVAVSVTLHNGYSYVFDDQADYVHPVWFSFFQAFAAFSNAGMSLVDASMIPFQSAYAMILAMIVAILGGNTAFPVFLRCMIWTMNQLLPLGPQVKETFRFLLDHPRRCFVYLFPAHQTWLLMLVLVMLNGTDWVAFGVLDIGNPAVEVIPIGNRVMDGLFQAFSVRTAGFSIVNLSTLSPAVKLLYLIMMYISAYPIAMSVRSTNVYEEKSMGVFAPEDEEEDAPSTEWRSYLAWHIRKQLAFDIWWLFLAMLLVCIIERGKINDVSDTSVDIFPIMFEVVSGYGTNGMSLGVSDNTYSLSGHFGPLSKLVLILVMLRGRHRGLPVAIDRAVVLPYEFTQRTQQEPRFDDSDLEDAPRDETGHPASELPSEVHEQNGDTP